MKNRQTSRFFSRRLIENREMRIFLSSTFSDMALERQTLIKTFEMLKIEANRRNVTLCVLDLRWGVTEDESRSGKVLSVCLEEIEHSHPFFIGLLGNCYGSSPNVSVLEKNPELEERYPWIREDINNGLSFTEIEMQYGALRNEHDVDALFFLKNTNIADDNEKLTRLKLEINTQDRFPKSEYTSIDDLCQKVERGILDILDKHFPDQETTRLGRERIAQKAYINSQHGHYQKPIADFKRLDCFLNGDETHLVITGSSGIGKSALIANWLKEKEKAPQPYNIIYHFVGNTFSGSDHRQILEHICDELYNLYGIERNEGLNEKLEEEAQRILVEAGQKDKPVLVVIDGINQIADYDHSKLLNWLPQAPHTTKYIFSTLEGDETMETFKRRAYPIHQIGKLDRKSRREFIISYLHNVGKKLTDKQINRIIDDPENENMLVLKTLLDELICFGSRQQLDKRIDYYLSSSSIDDFFDRMLQRMEADYEEVPRILSLIALSESGMTEDELQSITRLRPVDIHLFYCAFYNHFITRDGLVTFGHQYVTDAVWRRYGLKQQTNAYLYREQIIDCISKEKGISETRKISELAFQYYHTDNNESLYKIILSFNAFRYFNASDKGDATLAHYWRRLLESNPEKYQMQNYLNLPDEETVMVSSLIEIAEFIYSYFGDNKTSLRYSQKALAMCADGGSVINEATCYNDIGTVYEIQGNYSGALESYMRALVLQEKEFGKNHLETATSINNIGSIYDALGDYGKALDYYSEALEIQKNELGDYHPDIATSYNNIGGIYYKQGDFSNALSLLLKAMEIKEMVLGADHLVTATSYNNIGIAYDTMDKYPEALNYYYKALEVKKKVLGEYHPDIAVSYNNIGLVFIKQADYQNALDYYTRALEIFESKLGRNTPQSVTSYNNIGGVYKRQGDFSNALDCYFTALEIQKGILGPDHPETATIYNNIGGAYDRLNDYTKALEYFFMALDIQETVLGTEHTETAATYNNIGSVYESQGDYDKALEYYFKALVVFEKVHGIEHTDTADCYNNIGYVYDTQGDYDKALEYFFKDLAICEKVYGIDHPSTAMSYNNIGAVYRNKRDYAKAMDYFVKALNIKKKVLGEDSAETATSYNNVGSVYNSKGDFDRALEFFLKALNIFEKVLGFEHLDTATCYNNIGGIYKEKDDYDKALEYYLKDLAICERVLGLDHPDTAISLVNIGGIYMTQGDYDQALECCSFALEIIEEKLGKQHPTSQIVRNNIEVVLEKMKGVKNP